MNCKGLTKLEEVQKAQFVSHKGTAILVEIWHPNFTYCKVMVMLVLI